MRECDGIEFKKITCDICGEEIVDRFGGWFTSPEYPDICKECFEKREAKNDSIKIYT